MRELICTIVLSRIDDLKLLQKSVMHLRGDAFHYLLSRVGEERDNERNRLASISK